MESRSTIRLMTFNLLFSTARSMAGPWEERRRLALDLLREWEPDVIGFQEVMDGPMQELQAELPGYEVVGSKRTGQSKIPLWTLTLTPAMLAGGLALLRGNSGSQARRVAGGALLAGAALPVVGTLGGLAVNRAAMVKGAFSPIFYRRDRLRLLDTRQVRLSERPNDPLTLMLGTWLPRYATTALLETRDGRRFGVTNLHLDYMPLVTRGSLEKLRAHLDANWDGTPQFVMGDFNADLDDEECAFLTRAGEGSGAPGFESSWCEARERRGPEHTLHGGMGEESPQKKRADHIMARPSLSMPRCTTVTHHSGDLYPSDHYPVVVDVELPMVTPVGRSLDLEAAAR